MTNGARQLAPLPITMERREDYSTAEVGEQKPGHFIIEQDETPHGYRAVLYYVCPGQQNCALRISTEGTQDRNKEFGGAPPVWGWDGNTEQPTLNPSINCHHCGWHGWIQKGVIT